MALTIAAIFIQIPCNSMKTEEPKFIPISEQRCVDMESYLAAIKKLDSSLTQELLGFTINMNIARDVPSHTPIC